jgi:hypothetical protein
LALFCFVAIVILCLLAVDEEAHSVRELLALVKHPFVSLAVEPAGVIGVLEIELLVDDRVDISAVAVRQENVMVGVRVACVPQFSVVMPAVRRILRSDSCGENSRATHTLGSERRRPHHDNTNAVVGDDFCCLRRGWLACGGFFLFLLFVHLRHLDLLFG